VQREYARFAEFTEWALQLTPEEATAAAMGKEIGDVVATIPAFLDRCGRSAPAGDEEATANPLLESWKKFFGDER